ncbi:hypothetical protein F4805DRAFT_405807 [Annulohypoxylon moriforme]|nr:hypothetical protein F4805DRAFT_405807 [Annulohypoxylon moriforme]
MRASAFFLTSMAVVAVKCYKIDPSLPDGAYFVPLLNSTADGGLNKFYGKPIRIGDVIKPQTTGSDKVQFEVVGQVPVPADSHACYDSTEDSVDHNAARHTLEGACNDGPIPGWYNYSGVILARYASSLAFACNWSGNMQQCAPNEINDSYNQISNNCGGDMKGGHICASSWKKCYGHSTVMGEICDNDV